MHTLSRSRMAVGLQDVYPGLRDTVISGVCHYGESYEDTAVREVSEELGLPTGMLQHSTLSCKQVFRWSDASCDVWGCAFVVVLPAEAKLHLQQEEVDDAAFVPLHEVRIARAYMLTSCATPKPQNRVHVCCLQRHVKRQV